MPEYFIQIDQLARLLKPPIPTKELIRNIVVDKVSGLSNTEVIGAHSNEILRQKTITLKT